MVAVLGGGAAVGVEDGGAVAAPRPVEQRRDLQAVVAAIADRLRHDQLQVVQGGRPGMGEAGDAAARQVDAVEVGRLQGAFVFGGEERPGRGIAEVAVDALATL